LKNQMLPRLKEDIWFDRLDQYDNIISDPFWQHQKGERI